MVEVDSLFYPYSSRRMPIYAYNGMVAASQPLASQAGLHIMKIGGNAIDAAVATAAALTVLEPTANGIGGDAFALVWTQGSLHGLNASGPSPKSISREKVLEAGYKEMPPYGLFPITVPGAPSAWVELSKRFGKLSLNQVLEPAIDYAENGYPISPVLGNSWQSAYKGYRNKFKGKEFSNWFATFAPKGRAPKIGELWSSHDHAKTLRLIGESEGAEFYKGELADKIDQFSRKFGGFLRKEDLVDYKPEWVTPISVNYKGYDVWEIPPNGQGLVALMALNILKEYEFPTRDVVDTYHWQIEAMKLAFADGLHYITDPTKMNVAIESLLSQQYSDSRRKLISDKALEPKVGQPPKSGTVYFATADNEGNMVSFIQSNYMGFGSGIVVPETGIALQNRGHTFSLDPTHDNSLEPEKKTYHTIIPGFLTKNNNPVGPFGVMGGFMQPQGHLQVIMNTIDFKLNPQVALDAPRWQWMRAKTVAVEQGVPDHIIKQLSRKGHDVKIAVNESSFGRGQIIWRNKDDVLIAGSEPRTDGAAIGY